MVSQKNIFTASLITFLVGIFILLTIIESFELQTSNIKTIQNNPILDQQVKVEGTVKRITVTNTTIILNLKDKTSEIPIILFTETAPEIKKGDYLIVKGKVTIYENITEIEADLITKKCY